MQHRMKTHMLTKEQMEALLTSAEIGTLATLNADGSPYVTPVHFVYDSSKIYVHGLPRGQRIDNIRRSERTSFNVYRMDGYLLDKSDRPCDTNTQYQSVIIQGKASFVENLLEKERVLKLIVKKYALSLSETPLSESMVKGTAVTVINIDEITGKYWD